MSRTITIVFNDRAENILEYLTDKYQALPEELVIMAINEYYKEDVAELERKEE